MYGRGQWVSENDKYVGWGEVQVRKRVKEVKLIFFKPLGIFIWINQTKVALNSISCYWDSTEGGV